MLIPSVSFSPDGQKLASFGFDLYVAIAGGLDITRASGASNLGKYAIFGRLCCTEKMEVKINTLTPLWTGGIDAGKCDRIHETGILGSLRWWMEVLVRGVGGNACDPCDPTEQKCLYDPKKPNNGLCDVCQIFGATGWKRRFRLDVIQDNTQPDKTVTSTIQADRSNSKKGKYPIWYFPNDLKDKPRAGAFTIQIQSLHPDFKSEVIGGLIQFMADWSALGARPQMGFGAIEIELPINMQPLHDWLITIPGSKTLSDYKGMPLLQNIFLARIQPKISTDSFTEQETFNLKYDLRSCFRSEEVIRTEENKIQVKSESKGLILKKDRKDGNISKGDSNKDLRHFIMGTVDADRMAAKIKISRPYENDKLMRVWGWISEDADVYKNGWNREKVVDAIYQHLTAKYTLHDWREMNSMRDTQTPNISDAKVFLRSLLQLQEDG